MANLSDPSRVALEALAAWLLDSGNRSFGLGLKQAFSEWAEPGQLRQYPSASCVQVDWATDETSPEVVDDAVVTPGSALMHYGTCSGRVQADFWCNSRDQRQRIRTGMFRALHSSPSSPGLLIQPGNYWGSTISYSQASIANRDSDEGIARGEFRLTMFLEVEAALLVELPGVATTTTVKLLASLDPGNPANQVDTVTP
jgi:hypothetical protein